MSEEENGQTEVKQETPPEAPKEARTWIDKGLLHVEVPLFMPNGEFIAYGMLHKATQIVNIFFRTVERESQKDAELTRRIITPAGMPRAH